MLKVYFHVMPLRLFQQNRCDHKYMIKHDMYMYYNLKGNNKYWQERYIVIIQTQDK